MNDEMARVAEDLAGEGWTVLIPDLFARGSKPLCGGALPEDRGDRAGTRAGRPGGGPGAT